MAQKFCQRALELEPDNIQALETCGTLLLEMEELPAAKHVSMHCSLFNACNRFLPYSYTAIYFLYILNECLV